MEITMLGKKLKLEFRNYANGNIKLTGTSKGRAVSISCNTILKLNGKVIAVRDSRNMIDELIHANLIEDTYVNELNESGNKMLVYRLTDFCKQNQGE